MANCTLTADDLAAIQKVARESGLSHAAFMQLFATPCFQQGLQELESNGGARCTSTPYLILKRCPRCQLVRTAFGHKWVYRAINLQPLAGNTTRPKFG